MNKIPRGNSRKLILCLGDIQFLIGSARGAAMNDRDTNRMTHVLEALDKAFQLCLDARGLYSPIDRNKEDITP